MAKKFLKLVAASFVSLGIAFTPLAFGGCGTTSDNEKDPGYNIVTPNPDKNPEVTPNPDDNKGENTENKDSENDQNKQPEDQKPQEDENKKYDTTKIPRADISDFVQLVRQGKNYTLEVSPVNGNDFGGTLERDGDNMYFTDISSGENYFVTKSGEDDIQVSYNTKDNKWMGSVMDSSDESLLTVANADREIPLLLNSISYSLYNTKTHEYKGSYRNAEGVFKNVSIFINKDGDTIKSFEMNVKDETDPYTITFSYLGTTSVAIPNYSLSGAEIGSSKNVLTVENGKYNFDYVLLQPIVENWLKGDNSYKTDLVDMARPQRNCETEQVVFMNLSKNNLELYIAYKDLDENQRYITQFNVVDRQLYRELESGKNVTENELVEYFKSSVGGVESPVGSKTYSVDYITTDDDFASHKAQFNALTNKVFERAQTVGEQGYSVENSGTKVDYSDYNIICAFKTVPTSPNSLDFKCEGLNQSFDMVYLTEKDGTYNLTDILVVSSVERGLSNVYTNITDYDASSAKNWMVSKSTNTEMSSENAALYDYSATTTKSVNYNASDVIVDNKDYSL